MTDKKNGILGRLALLATTLIWGTSFVILKSALDHITPLWVLAIRFCGAALILLLVCIPVIKKVDKNYLIGGALMGLMLSAAYTVQTYGLVYTTPGKNAFLTATYCVLVPFLYWLFYNKKPDKYNVGAAIICLVGMGFVCLNEDLAVNIGDMLTICCGLFYGIHIIVTSRYVEGRNPMLLTAIQFAVAGIICFLAALIFEPAPKNVPADSWYAIAYLCIVCTGVCYVLQTFGQKHTPPSAASIILTLESVFGTVISIALGREDLTLSIAIGFCLIFAAVLISETKLDFLKSSKHKNKP